MQGVEGHIENLWTGLLQLIEKLVVPDWGALINLLPLFLVLGVLGPLLTLGLLAWTWYFLRKPRARVSYEDGPTRVLLGDDGQPMYPRGLPYSASRGLIYPPGRTRGDAGEDLSVICPMCGIGRGADIDTCGNCGLVLKVEPRARLLAPIGPPPGGAAIA
ncbi:MAG: hypothetical protein FJ038_07080 [Chloroflexi bacterium]|nr:hypothetical protein [Chloroflexota bacterium]